MPRDQVIAFSEQQQEAVIGHTFNNPELWDYLDGLGFTKEWIVSNALRDVCSYIEKFRANFKRPPANPQELLEQTREEPAYKKSAQTILARCVEAAKVHGLDVLKTKFVSWAKSSLIRDRCTEISIKYNDGKHDESFAILEKAALELKKLDVNSGCFTDELRPAAARLQGERECRLRESEVVLSYGVTFLDDALVGIGRRDLVLLGGKTGVGKTELVLNIAATNVANGRRVAVFALEAEERELERRMKYRVLAHLYRESCRKANHPASLDIGYGAWRLGKLEGELAPFDQQASDVVSVKLAGMKTYYRVQSDFGAEDLEREVYAIRGNTDLIVVDHLHYMDLDDDENENRAMKLLVKKLRDLALVVGIPIVVVAHLRKGTGRPLIPSLEDFHGSSDIVKIATTAILFGPARQLTSSDTRTTGGATFMHIAKCRVDGSRTREVGLAFFDYQQGRYRPDYAIGRLNGPCTNWNVLTGGSKPPWAKNATIEDVSLE